MVIVLPKRSHPHHFVGVNSAGCCPENKCKAGATSHDSTKGTGENIILSLVPNADIAHCCLDPGFKCAFGNYVAKWLQSHSAAKINYFNKAIPAFSTLVTSRSFYDLIEDRNEIVHPFTSNDIILLDHSVTDFVCFRDQHLMREVLLEFLNRLYGYRASASDLPVIIMLEMETRSKHRHLPFPYTINQKYANVSELFHIPFWSYREAVGLNGEWCVEHYSLLIIYYIVRLPA